MMTFLALVSLAFNNPVVSVPHGSDGEEGMSDFAESLIVSTHYIIIKQESQTTLLVDEKIWFNNTADEDFRGKIYIWSQPSDYFSGF
ncbi:MAG: hypothetical protein QF682_12570 [Candidatus Thermoplasmatota archaeon]|jgi:hypothetical protein|nr:hypothetical protein [Candidatus Thermoplasmatota archaeon]